MSGFEREGRYIVVKPDFMDSSRTMRLRSFIEEMCFETPDCVVVEADWPEYELVWKMIEERVTGKQSGSGWDELKQLANEVNTAFPDKEDLWSMTCTPNVVLDLIADIERLGLTVGSLEFAKWSCQVNQEAIKAAGHETIDELAAERDQLKATIAQQAQMIEHLRGGLIQGAPIAWYTEDHLTDKSATTYDSAMAERWRAKGWPVKPLYDKPSEHPSGFTGVDMADSSADGRRSLAEYLIKQIAIEHPDQDTLLTVKYIAQWIALETGL